MGTHHDRHWGEHPAVPTGDELSLGDRAADALLSIMGSWPFVIGFMLTMAAWITLNTVHWFFHWDEQPYGVLNLGLSCLAGLQGSIILIASKRQNAIAAALAKDDRETIEFLVQINQRQTELLEELHARLELPEKEAQP